jgi:hypothetical protein
MRPFALLLICLLLGGCASRADHAFAADGIVTGTSGAVPGYGLKLVQGKQGETEVVGDDGSVCRLTPERFKHIKIGQWLSCNWTIAPEAADTAPVVARAAS